MMRSRLWLGLALGLAAAALVGGAAILVNELFSASALGADILADLSSVERIEMTLQAWGAWSKAASVGLMVLHSFVPFPAEAVAMANGMLFGLGTGVALTWSGAMAGAFLAFALARWLGHPFVQRLLGEDRARAVADWSHAHGAGDLLVVRLIPLISFNLVNYAAGLAGIGWWTFAWTTAIGILPITVASVLVGSHMIAAPAWVWVAVALAAAALLAARIAWRWRR